MNPCPVDHIGNLIAVIILAAALGTVVAVVMTASLIFLGRLYSRSRAASHCQDQTPRLD